ncbi:MAG: flagellar biosynthetic protein FliR [Pseudomonadota bacterium]
MARPFGLTFAFIAFAWGRLTTGVLRTAFALAIALPVVAPWFGRADDALVLLEGPILLFLAKELFIGGLIGFVASIPFAVVMGAGNIIDTYRGGFIGSADPTGAQSTVLEQAFVIVALWLFAALNGFWIVTDLVYTSYGVWPMFEALPALSREGLLAFVELLKSLIVGAFVLSAPLLFLMMLSDFVFLVSAKLGKQINVTHLIFSTKNLIMIIALPIFAIVYIRVITGDLQAVSGLLTIVEGALR